jgi:UDP-N-acetylglucosamine transferase subunit ALG13
MENGSQKRGRKTALVLTGATAAFNELIKEALEPEVLQKLYDEDFNVLVFQAGHGIQYCLDLIRDKPKSEKYPEIMAFDFKDSLTNELKSCKYRKDYTEEGLVMTHAGQSSLLQYLLG